MPRIRMTLQRRLILSELRNVSTHPTADRIYDMVRRRMPRISLGTVYRNLDILAELGWIQRQEAAGTQRRFDGNPENHYHVRCIRCGCLEDAPVEPVDQLEETCRRASDFQILGHRVEFIGLCPGCRPGGGTREERRVAGWVPEPGSLDDATRAGDAARGHGETIAAERPGGPTGTQANRQLPS